ncbi:twin-arginine translocation signal domain-containing protein [Halonotius terrestris]|uniref:Twin-arginine translocation signal domain-containing protein n=1 Tax=Halonotius terrestris TaxID=2487750 RepID=A0A8J8PC09_9EURY|nr:twin-arginine translocation signal domain-containing protein [Halonotius terrestris]TQQ81242.1 twin-arginine translocation signal domain-containing protein [Halonotius terrestris]
MLSRRRALATVGIAVATGGCAALPEEVTDPTANGSSGNSTADNGLAPGEARLGSITLQSTDDDTHTIQIAVEDSDGIVHLDSYDLTADEPSVTVTDEWGETASEYRITVRSDSTEPRTITVADRLAAGSDCVALLILLDAEGEFRVWNRDCSP